MQWSPYKACCRRHAADVDIAFCPECRHPLLRCQGFGECGSLLTPQQPCPAHVQPALLLNGDDMHAPQVGDRMNLPLVLANRARFGAPLRVTQVYRMRHDDPPEALDLPWESLASGQQRRFSVDTDPLDSGGSIAVSLTLVLAVNFDGIDEEYAFSGAIGLKVARQDTSQVVQNIHIEGSHFGTGSSGVMQTGPSMQQGLSAVSLASSDSGLSEVPLEHAERFERTQGVRGYAASGVQVPRTVELRCDGFPADDAPPRSAPFLTGNRLGCGRSAVGYASNGVGADAAGASAANYLCLRAYAGGAVLRDVSMGVSRRHFELILRSGRLYLRNLGRGGRLNGGALVQGETALLQDGDRFNPLDNGDARLDCRVSFECEARSVARIHLHRSDVV